MILKKEFRRFFYSSSTLPERATWQVARTYRYTWFIKKEKMVVARIYIIQIW